jgi:hypothetical protein
MAKAPVKALTQKAKLGKLKALHIAGDNVKRFKDVAHLWADYTAAFPKNTASNQTFLKASPAALKACDSVNMRTIGGAVVFPTGSGGIAKLRETKQGVFIDYGPRGAKRGKFDTIILSKDGNHIKYGMSLAKREARRSEIDDSGEPSLRAWGTLKTHAYNTKKNKDGEMIRGFMRDVATSYPDALDALYDNRYGAGGAANQLDPHPLTTEWLEKLQATNGTAAMIRVNY